MSKISVLKSNGQWSEPILGLDKVHLMKSAIQHEYTKTEYWKERAYGDKYADTCILEELEIDTMKIYTDFMDEYPVIENNIVNWFFFNKNAGVDLSKAKLLKMRLSTLQEIVKYETLLAPIYDALIMAAEIPSPTPDEYCLTFKFEAE